MLLTVINTDEGAMLRTYTIIKSLFFMLASINGYSMYAMTDNNQTQEQSQHQKMLQEHIALYAHCKASSKSELINLFKFEALSFFVRTIKNQDVLTAIFQSIKDFPDRAIKLFFFCLDLQCRGLWNDKSMPKIERFVQKLIRYNYFQHITFKYNNLREPILAVHDLRKEWMAPDIYDVSGAHGFWCCIL